MMNNDSKVADQFRRKPVFDVCRNPRDMRYDKFVAEGPGWAGYKLSIDPEEDGDEAVQIRAGANAARIEETDLAVDAHRRRELSLEALEGLGMEFTTEDADDDREEEGDEDWDDGDFEESVGPPEGTILTYRSAEVNTIATAGRRQGSPVFNTAAICRQAVEAAKLVSKALVAEEARKATVATPQPAKGNGNGRKPAMALPPVGKFLAGVVVDQGHKGLLVKVEGVGHVRVPIALERGHGSWEAAARWVLGFKRGTKIRLRVAYVNGTVEAVLADRHPRPFWQQKEVKQIAQAPAGN